MINYQHYGKVLEERAKRGMSVGIIHPMFQEKLESVDRFIFDKTNNDMSQFVQKKFKKQ